VDAPYADLTNVTAAAVGADEPVFLTSGSYAGSLLTTFISFVRAGRDAWIGLTLGA